jgi:hypothetical protein
MTTITILPETTANGANGIGPYQAVAGKHHSSGRTVGEALDALTGQMPQPPETTLVLVQHFKPDEHFTAEQRHRLTELMARWRAARAAGTTLNPAEQAELDSLAAEEVRATRERAAGLLRGLAP